MVSRERSDGALQTKEKQRRVRVLGADDQRTDLEILRGGEWCRRLEVSVPFSQMLPEDPIVDTGYVDELAVDMETSEQGESAWHRARIVDGKVGFETIDGFHRKAALIKNSAKAIRATVDYNMPDEQFLRERIIATSKQSVEFPRVAQWIDSWWQNTRWAEMGISARKAMSLTASKTETSTLISNEELAQLREEVLKYCKSWGKSTSYFRNILVISEDCDPDLIREVRVAKAGRGKVVGLTPSRLAPIIAKFPGEDNYKIQRFIAEAAVDGSFSAAQVNYLVFNVSTIIDNSMPDEEIKKWINQVVVDFNIPEFKADKTRRNSEIEEEDSEDEDEDETPNKRQQNTAGGSFAGPRISMNSEIMREVTSFGRSHKITPEETLEVVARVVHLLGNESEVGADVVLDLLGYALEDVRAGVGVNRKDEIFGDNNLVNREPAPEQGIIILTDLIRPKDNEDGTSTVSVGSDKSRKGRTASVSIDRSGVLSQPTFQSGPESARLQEQDPEAKLKRIGGWWELWQLLSSDERRVMLRVFSNNIDAELTGVDLGQTTDQILSVIHTVLEKQILARRVREK